MAAQKKFEKLLLGDILNDINKHGIVPDDNIEKLSEEQMSDMLDTIGESVLDPVQDGLSEDLWDKNEKLLSKVKKYLVDTLQKWLKTQKENTEIDEPSIKEMYVLGSMTGYQYTKEADIDVNFILPLPEATANNFRKAMNKELNGKFLPGTKHPINYYVSPEFNNDWKKDGAIYDVFKAKWLTKASQEQTKSVVGNYKIIIEIARFFTAGFDIVLSEFNADKTAYENFVEQRKHIDEGDLEDYDKLISMKLQEVVADIDGVYIAKHLLRSLRTEALEKDKSLEISSQIIIKDNLNNSINNLIYKYIEKLGYFEKVQKVLELRNEWKEKLEAK